MTQSKEQVAAIKLKQRTSGSRRKKRKMEVKRSMAKSRKGHKKRSSWIRVPISASQIRYWFDHVAQNRRFSSGTKMPRLVVHIAWS